MKKIKRMIFLFLLVILAAAACSQDDTATDISDNGTVNELPPKQDPITLELYQYSARLTDDEFIQFFKEPVEKQFPHITMGLVRSGSGMNLTDLAASGEWPDLFYTGFRGLRNFMTVAAAQDLRELAKKANLNLNLYDPTALQGILNYSNGQELYALPMFNNFAVMYYNKDIFDQFGVDYPKDGMLWEEAVELTKLVTREQDGVQYIGTAVDGREVRLGEQLSLPYVDANTNKAVLQSDGWKRVFQVYEALHDIPGIDRQYGKNAFMQDRNIAMLSSYGATLGELESLHNEGNPINYDLATIPSFSEAPNKGFAASAFILGVFVTSELQDASMEVIKYLSTDSEYQKLGSKYGKLTAIQDVKVKDVFGENLKSVKGKNLKAITNSELAPLPPFSPYENIPQGELNRAMELVISGEMDINSALRLAEEASNQKIEQELKAE